MSFYTKLVQIQSSYTNSSALSYNRPFLSGTATWNPNATTLGDNQTVGNTPHDIFIDIENNFYFAHYRQQKILWGPPNQMISNYKNFPCGSLPEHTTFFVSAIKYIYVEDGALTGHIVRRSTNGTINQSVFTFTGSFRGLFIDSNDTLYCSIRLSNHVDTIYLHGNRNSSIMRASTGTAGNTLNQHWGPWGILVDDNFDLYVADANNNRIQVFLRGQSNGTTIAGNGVPNSLFLQLRTDVIFDGNLYVVDEWNHRIQKFFLEYVLQSE